MAVSDLPIPTIEAALRLAAALVAQVQIADQRSGLINRPLLRTAGELAQALAKIGIEAPSIVEDVHERRG